MRELSEHSVLPAELMRRPSERGRAPEAPPTGRRERERHSGKGRGRETAPGEQNVRCAPRVPGTPRGATPDTGDIISNLTAQSALNLPDVDGDEAGTSVALVVGGSVDAATRAPRSGQSGPAVQL